jgi:ABC-type antimicrobial peptide transport system permease subunit
LDFYSSSDYNVIQANIIRYSTEISDFLGFFPIIFKLPILEEMLVLSLAVLFLGLLFTLVIVIFIAISVVLIYSLLLTSVETKSYEIGIFRMVGLNKRGLFLMVFSQALMFVLPALMLAVGLSFPSLAAINYFLLEPIMGVSFIPVPSLSGFAWGLSIGFIIPIFSSIVPLQVVLGKNLNDALDYQHSKVKSQFVKIIKSNSFDRMPYVVFGALSVFYGMSIYYFFPLALLSFNFQLLLTIFFVILLGILLGLTLIAINF